MNRIHAVDRVGFSRRNVNEPEEDVVATCISQITHRQTRQAIAEVIRLGRARRPARRAALCRRHRGSATKNLDRAQAKTWQWHSSRRYRSLAGVATSFITVKEERAIFDDATTEGAAKRVAQQGGSRNA